MAELADFIEMKIRNIGIPQVWGVGQVTAHNAPEITVAYLGDTYPIHHLASYSPTVGDVVLLLTGGDQMIALGKIST